MLPVYFSCGSRGRRVKGRPHYYSTKREEYAQIKFDLSADLSSLFNWNTKQLFVYVLATYPVTDKKGNVVASEPNEAIIWDTIIPAPVTPWAWSNIRDRIAKRSAQFSTKSKRRKPHIPKPAQTKDLANPGVVTLKNQKPKYQITHPSGLLANRENATLTVGWNVQPWVGALVWDKGLLGGRLGQWKVDQNGVSDPWAFPALKGSRQEAAKNEPNREGKKLEEGKAKEAVPT